VCGDSTSFSSLFVVLPEEVSYLTSREFSRPEAEAIGEKIGVDWAVGDVDIEQFRIGLAVELEHGSSDPATDVTHDDELMTGRIVLAHLNELRDYYTRLAAMEQEADS
jgi:pyrimidine operon attenuation protein/uracil phosphoribosyltransferase